MRLRTLSYFVLAFDVRTIRAQAPSPSSLLTSAQLFASSLKGNFPNQSLATLPTSSPWWISGSAIDTLVGYRAVTGDKQYDALIGNTLVSQAQGGFDFNNLQENGNDDQPWWALAALSAAENGLPQTGPVPWIDIARNAFNEQKGRWEATSCGGGLKWKIQGGEAVPGWHYRSTISNGLFFQMAARIAMFTGDPDALAWAEKAYDWVVTRGLIDADFNVYDGTDDTTGTCVDVNRNQWSYSVGVFVHGSAVMAAHTQDPKWATRTRGFIASAKRTFTNPTTGALFEPRCDPTQSCNRDQVSFKATLARWLGAAVVVFPEVKTDVAGIVDRASTVVQNGPTTGLNYMDSFIALEIVDASFRLQGWKPGKRNIAGRLSW